MKKYLALLGAAMFFVVCMSLYLMMESASMSGHNGEYAMGDNYDSIDNKIKQIEKDLQRNHKTISKIKETVRDIANGDREGLHKLQQALNIAVESREASQTRQSQKLTYIGLSNMSAVEIPSNVCTFAETPPSKRDLQMFDVYDALKFDNPDGGVWKQGWDIKYDPKMYAEKILKVFVVPHSHNDPGWLKTFERYYQDQTKHILDNMVEKLEQHSKMKFIYAEMSFFSMWWGEISSSKRTRVKKLIEDKRLEIVTGGWVMTDEANAHYFAMLDQIIEGNQWLLDNVGTVAKNGWAIDPFGHSPSMAYLLQGAQFDNMLIQRIHYSTKKHLAKSKQLEFNWRQSWDQSGTTDMFCHMMPFYSYDVPHTCGPDPKICCQFDFKRLPGGRVTCPWKVPPQEINSMNVAQKAEILLDQYRKKSQLYQNNVVLIPLGDDFRYDKTVEWDQQYQNYMKLFDYMNAQKDWHVEAKFGTLSDYFNALRERSGEKSLSIPNGYPTLSGDFFTYSDRDDHYWSGYYTSRPFYKKLDRVMEAHLRSADIIYTLAAAKARQNAMENFPEASLMNDIVSARRNLGLYQHHDGITGTAKDHVVVDYGARLLQSIKNMKKVIIDSAQFLLTPTGDRYAPDSGFFFDVDEQQSNHDSMPEKTTITLNKQLKPIVFYNSLSHSRNVVVCLYVTDSNVEVLDPEGHIIPSQINPYWINDHDLSSALFKLHFVVSLPGLGLSTYGIKVAEGANAMNSLASIDFYNSNYKGGKSGAFLIDVKKAEEITIENQNLSVTISTTSGTIASLTQKHNKQTTRCYVQFLTYGVTNKKDKSGAYLFMPDGPAKELPYERPFVRVLKGPILSEVQSKIPHIDHLITLENSEAIDSLAVHIQNIVDIRSQSNMELVMRIVSDVKNKNHEWYSDLNGFQIQRRRTHDGKIPLQGNFYPMPTMAYLQDEKTRMSVLSGQSLGVASLEQGWVEIIQDRRLSQDDNRGLGQGVLDNKKTPNMFLLLVESRSKKENDQSSQTGYPSLVSHLLSLQLIHPVHVLPKHSDTSSKLVPRFQPLAQNFPCDIHLLNLRSSLKNDNHDLQTGVLLHRLGVDCGFPTTGVSCSNNFGKVNFSQLFTGFKWKDLRPSSFNLIHDSEQLDDTQDVTIPSMEIKVYKGCLR